MDNDLDQERTSLREEIPDDVRYRRRYENIWRRLVSLDLTPQRRILIFVGAGILLLIVLIAIFPGGGEKLATEDLSSIQTRLNQFEQRLSRLEGTVQSEGSMRWKLDELANKVDELEKRIVPLDATAATKRTVQKKPTALTEGRYHEVQPGDNLYRIALRYGISLEELCRLNNITPKQVIYPGQKLLVSPSRHQ